MPEFRTGSETGFGRLLHHLTEGRTTFEWLSQNLRTGDLVIVYNFYGTYIPRIIALCKMRRVPVIVDTVEWYDVSQCPGGRFGLVHWEVEYCLRKAFRQADGIIAIGSFLARHFSRSNRTLVLPPLVDLTDSKWTLRANRLASSEFVKLAYAGTPARKDNLSHLLSALKTMEGEADRRFFLTLVGPDRSQLARFMNEARVGSVANVQCLGRLSHQDAIRAVAESDFSVLIRPDRRYAHAGFSTKFVESMAAGVPPFCNVTSDIGVYTRDGVDSIHIANDSTAEILKGLFRIGQLSIQERAQLSSAARATAKRHFDWQNYPSQIEGFLHEVMHKGNRQ